MDGPDFMKMKNLAYNARRCYAGKPNFQPFESKTLPHCTIILNISDGIQAVAIFVILLLTSGSLDALWTNEYRIDGEGIFESALVKLISIIDTSNAKEGKLLKTVNIQGKIKKITFTRKKISIQMLELKLFDEVLDCCFSVIVHAWDNRLLLIKPDCMMAMKQLMMKYLPTIKLKYMGVKMVCNSQSAATWLGNCSSPWPKPMWHKTSNRCQKGRVADLANAMRSI
ncbi:hypothetical protein T11_1641 [Trichinella zimbabwensis]|uniref:Uncharacterized protein n=1 Tax=Trichinella zimbabwensis TaxID=268475 RepID=A0A0V1I8R0_9BILA|nr:hypothetical protein T11_1641 [Trichinella zimbabwensis]